MFFCRVYLDFFGFDQVKAWRKRNKEKIGMPQVAFFWLRIALSLQKNPTIYAKFKASLIDKNCGK